MWNTLCFLQSIVKKCHRDNILLKVERMAREKCCDVWCHILHFNGCSNGCVDFSFWWNIFSPVFIKLFLPFQLRSWILSIVLAPNENKKLHYDFIFVYKKQVKSSGIVSCRLFFSQEIFKELHCSYKANILPLKVLWGYFLYKKLYRDSDCAIS